MAERVVEIESIGCATSDLDSVDLACEVVALFAVVDRGGTVAAMAEPEGWPFYALFSAPDLGFEYEGV